MKKKIINTFISLFIFFLLFPLVVSAASISASFSGDSTYKTGQTVSLNIHVGSVPHDGTDEKRDGKIYAFSGSLNYDSSCLEYESVSAHSGWDQPKFNSGNKKLILANSGLDVGVSNGNVGTVKFKALKDCSTSVSISGAEAADKAGDVNVNFSSKSIKIYTPSSNNNLSSLNVSPGGINFNGGTSYSTSVGANVTSVTVTAAAQDSKASVSGTGSHSLSYGANEIKVTVTAESGAKKVYTINVNRKDDRSTNNNLASLKVSNGKLNPGFSKSNTKYSMEVPYAIDKLDISAKAEDSKASVSISNPDLVAEETTTVTIKVTAENGTAKTYTISVKRGKDPNKPLSNNNYLSNLSVSTGTLSPSFDKDKLNYAVYLPFEVSYIDITAEVEDTKYATINKEGDNNLSIGNNLFKYTVTAEDGSKRVYTLTVVRNDILDKDSIKLNDNTYLKKLSIKNGILTSRFKKKKNVYYYYSFSKKVDIKKAIPEIKDNKVSIHKMNKSFVIVVEATSGAKSYYLLIEKSIIPVIIIILLVLTLIITFIVIKLKNKQGKENNNKKIKKNDKKEVTNT